MNLIHRCRASYGHYEYLLSATVALTEVEISRVTVFSRLVCCGAGWHGLKQKFSDRAEELIPSVVFDADSEYVSVGLVRSMVSRENGSQK